MTRAFVLPCSLGVACFTFAVCVLASAGGDEVPSYAFSFHGTEGCDDEGAFVTSFESRTQGLHLVSGDPQSPIHIGLEARGDHTHAELSIRLDDGRVVQRSVEALSCAEAIEAIGFVAALALDPNAVSPVRTSPPGRPKPVSLAVARDTAAPPSAPPATFIWAVGASPQMSSGPTPDPLFGGGMALDLGIHASAAWTSSLRLSVAREWTRDFATTAGVAHFERTVGSFDVCPWRISFEPLPVQLVPCVQVTGGVLLAEGRATYAARRSQTHWGDAGLSLLLEVGLGEHVTWSTRGALGVPWTRERFQFDDQVFFEVAPLAATLSSGLFLRFE